MLSCFRPSLANGIFLNKLFTIGGRLFNPPRGRHELQCAESHRCEVNTVGNLACNFRTFFRISQRDCFRKALTKSERSDRFQPEKFLKAIEHVSYSMKYCKYYCLYTEEAVAFQTPNAFFTHPILNHIFTNINVLISRAPRPFKWILFLLAGVTLGALRFVFSRNSRLISL